MMLEFVSTYFYNWTGSESKMRFQVLVFIKGYMSFFGTSFESAQLKGGTRTSCESAQSEVELKVLGLVPSGSEKI